LPCARGLVQARTGRGIHGLPKVSCGFAMPDPYTPCSPPARRAACDRLLPNWIPLAVRPWSRHILLRHATSRHVFLRRTTFCRVFPRCATFFASCHVLSGLVTSYQILYVSLLLHSLRLATFCLVLSRPTKFVTSRSSHVFLRLATFCHVLLKKTKLATLCHDLLKLTKFHH
jgi:hypothetical protein